ncbi:hypothetical protein DL765_008940 [Monosporascus sp. GIB2]|nr:hypothetical protein DL765_008940 [Monosporascus sp. GIB2]
MGFFAKIAYPVICSFTIMVSRAVTAHTGMRPLKFTKISGGHEYAGVPADIAPLRSRLLRQQNIWLLAVGYAVLSPRLRHLALGQQLRLRQP